VFERWKLTGNEQRQQMAKVQRAIELHLLSQRQAEINGREGATVANLFAALDGIPSACITIGSLVILKYQVNGQPQLHARQLSDKELEAIELFPDLHTRPDRFFECLADAVALLPIKRQTES
jgi:hypothetical protein